MSVENYVKHSEQREEINNNNFFQPKLIMLIRSYLEITYSTLYANSNQQNIP